MRDACQYFTTSIVMMSLDWVSYDEVERGTTEAYEMGIKLLYRMMNVRMSIGISTGKKGIG